MTTEEAIAQFISEWKKIPPLARAATAGDTAKNHHQQAQAFQNEAIRYQQMKLPRRVAVVQRLVLEHAAIRDLFIALADEADKEATEAGIDRLVTGLDHKKDHDPDLAERAREAIAKISGERHEVVAKYWVASTDRDVDE